MPDGVQQKLEVRGLIDAYEQHPFYQRNDYLSWISRAKRIDTRRRRIEQMLEELEEGGVYMGMDHPPSRKT
jgi:uncharacterized protein YdeI (YjbR/CyaY-like superfamily)